ncbi:MAG: ABC transporter ATP-binding protein [Deltaproteobacteria bacterium]|nr:ABC transporter ATP-binding protein [Deltaproteobacteria bacterium]
MSQIEVRGLRKVYTPEGSPPVVALDRVSLAIEHQEFVAIVGPSGCGKSTLLYLVGGFVEPSEGEILVDGQPIGGAGPDRGIVFQHFVLFPWKTVRENIAFPLEELGVARAEREERVRQLVETVKLRGFEQAYPAQLSGGMRQRVALARTLAFDPAVLLMDEPFGALDAQTRRLMQEELLGLWSRKKKTVLFVTHDVREAVHLADRVVVMTARPGTVKEMVAVTVPREARDPEALDQRELVGLTNAIWRSVREEVERAER